MTQYDRRGAEITEGCYVIWHENRAGGYGTGLYTVLNVKNSVQLDGRDGYDPRWVNPKSCIVVESLPHVDDQHNTAPKKEGTSAWKKRKSQK